MYGKEKKEHTISPIYYTFLIGPTCARFYSLRNKKDKITHTVIGIAEDGGVGRVNEETPEQSPQNIISRKAEAPEHALSMKLYTFF